MALTEGLVSVLADEGALCGRQKVSLAPCGGSLNAPLSTQAAIDRGTVLRGQVLTLQTATCRLSKFSVETVD